MVSSVSTGSMTSSISSINSFSLSPIQKKVAFVAIPSILILGALPTAEGGPLTMAACVATSMGLTSGGFRAACVAACQILTGTPTP